MTMKFAEKALKKKTPETISKEVVLPRKQNYHPSPQDWRDEVLYFLLVDRFSDGNEKNRKLVDRKNLAAARPGSAGGEPWRWDLWAESGAERFQGGTLKGVESKLGYLKNLGVTCLWLSPVFKQRKNLDTYHGYGVQDFLEVDPRFGDRKDLVNLVSAAHEKGLRVILDVIFNHSGFNWLYPPDTPGGECTPWYTPGQYGFGSWIGEDGRPIGRNIASRDDGVWPEELQDTECYTRAGMGDLGAGDVNASDAVHKRSDFITLRDFYLDNPEYLNFLTKCYKYWIALSDCDGLRIDTLKHVYFNQARNFCGAIKEFASNLGKKNFFLVGEIAGGDYNADRYLDVLDRNLNAALDIGEMRIILNQTAKGLANPKNFFDYFTPGKAVMGSHRSIGLRHVSILDDHDHVFGEKIRFSCEASSDRQIASAVAMQVFTLGIPCIYYGDEQGVSGPEASERKWLPEWKTSDRYLREAMFGPEHPRKHGADGLESTDKGLDASLPGFGAFGTSGRHCFDENSSVYKRISKILSTRTDFPALRYGRQYQRPISFLGKQFGYYGPGEISAWSRILDDEEVLCVVNSHGNENRGARILVDANLCPPGSKMTVILNTAEIGQPTSDFGNVYPIWSQTEVKGTPEGVSFIEIFDMPSSEVILLTNHPEKGEDAEGEIVQ